MKAHFQRMAAYNHWANEKIYEAAGKLTPAAFAAPRAGFFPSLSKTLNHILVGDTIWMGRLDGSGHAGITALSDVLFTEFAPLQAARTAMDGRIGAFVEALTPQRMGEILIYKNMAGEAMKTPVDQVLAHFFNHQTHHRGQAHAMLSSTEVPPPSIDLILFLRDYAEMASLR